MTGGDSESDGGDFSIVYPPNTLAEKAKKKAGTLDDLLAKAEKMIAGMKPEFEGLVDRAVLQLPALGEQWRNPAGRPDAIKVLCNVANVLKSKSGSFGYGILGEIADLFRDYLRETPPPAQQADVIANYIGTLQLVWKQRTTGDGGEVGRQIVADFAKVNGRAKRPPA